MPGTSSAIAGADRTVPRAASTRDTDASAAVLFTDHLLAFELTSVLLLVAVIGAVVLAKRKI